MSKFKPRHLSISLDSYWLFNSQNHSLPLQTSSPSFLQSQDHFFTLVRLFLIHFFMHFIFCDLTFGVCWKIWGFSKLKRFLQNFGMGFVYLILKHHALHHMCITTMFHAFSFVFTLLQWLCVVRFGLGWAHDVFKFACHMFMHTYLQVSIFLYILSCWCFSNCLSLSLYLSFLR